MNKKVYLLSLLAFLTAAFIVTQSAAAEPRGPVQLEADTAEVDDAQGISIYRGNVILTRDNTRITGSVMWVYTDTNRDLQRIEVEGEPATYRDIPVDGENPRHAESPRMEYYAAGPERIVLLSGGRLWQGDNEVTGETITHFVAEGRTVADGTTEDGAGRVSVTVFPDQESTDE